MNVELLAAADRLASAGLNGLYQGLIVTGLVALSLRRSRSNAATRHAAWFATLLLVAFLVPAHALRRQLGSSPASEAHRAESSRERESLSAEPDESYLVTGAATEPGTSSPWNDDELLADGGRFLFPQPDMETFPLGLGQSS